MGTCGHLGRLFFSTHKAWGYHGFCQNRKLHLHKIKHLNLVTAFATITLSHKLCCPHFGHTLRAYAMSDYLWDQPDLYMLILLPVFFLLYKTCTKVMRFVVVMAPHATGAMPLFLIMQCHLCRFRFSLFHMSLLVCQTNGNDCCQ
jgi:hypothetical protein